jgi:predicted Zn-dependent peptidase
MKRGALLGSSLLALVLSAAPAAAQDPPVTRHVLPNGLILLVREHDAVPVVAVSLQIRAGSRFESPATAGVTNFLHRVMVRGTARRTAVQLAEATEDIGGSVEALGEVEAAEVRAHALARHWETLLALIAEVALEPSLPPAEIDRERRLLLGQITARADAPFSHGFDHALRDLYGRQHPYGQHSLGTRENVERLTRDDLLAHYRAIYRPDRMVLAVSGQVERKRVLKVVERLFGRLARSERGPAQALASPESTAERRVIERPAHQAQIFVGYLGPGLTDPLYPAVRVLGVTLGGGMAGRLFVELRDRRGLAYSTGVITPYRTGPAFFLAHLGTAPASAAAAEEGILRELDRARTSPISAEELARAKAYVRGQLAMDRRTNARQAWYLAFFEVVGAGWDFPDRYARAIEAVTAADVAAAAERYLNKPTIVVLQPPRR